MVIDSATFSQIAASLAHEVKNPLSLVKANIELLELTDGNKAYEKNYRVMRREIDRVNDLLLDFIQITNPVVFNTAATSVNRLLCELCDTMESAYGKKIDFRLNFRPKTSGREFIIAADEKKLRQVLHNILKNSVESIEDSANNTSGVICVDVTEPHGFVEIKITDNGKGLTPEQQKQTTEPFFTTKKNGCGLGLHFCKSIISRHGGTFGITGNEGAGCVVTLRLPKKSN